MAEGCNTAMFGNLSDRTAVATGIYVKRTDTIDPSNSGQGGIALKHTVEAWATEFGLYATQFHSRPPFYSGTKSKRDGPPFLPGDPGNLNPTYFTEYPEDIRMFGATFETTIPGGALLGELTYRPNQPLQYNSVDVISCGRLADGAVRPCVRRWTPSRRARCFHGWERHEAVQLQLGAIGQVPKVLGAVGLSYGGEIVYKGVPDLPDPSRVRFGRAEVFGQGPVDGVCPPPAAPLSCSDDGYVSRQCLRLSAARGPALRQRDRRRRSHPVAAVRTGRLGLVGRRPDPRGSQCWPAFRCRRRSPSRWTAAISWQPTWGGTYNNVRDRSTAQAYVSYQF